MVENVGSLSQNFSNLSLVRHAFGWNYKAWFNPFKNVKTHIPTKCSKVLEIGAGRLSLASLMFDGVAKEIVVGYYNEEDRGRVESLLLRLKEDLNLVSKYSIKRVDAFTVQGEYDIVILKSVLGGIFRTHNSTLNEVNKFAEDLYDRTVSKGGVLISIDNGNVMYQKLISSFGARKNHWRFFKKQDLDFGNSQYFFGMLSGFSFETRLGGIGHVLDNYIIYPIDFILSRIWTRSPTVIVSVI